MYDHDTAQKSFSRDSHMDYVVDKLIHRSRERVHSPTEKWHGLLPPARKNMGKSHYFKIR